MNLLNIQLNQPQQKNGARSLKTVFDDCISSTLFRIIAGEYSSISLVKPDNENNKPYILIKTKRVQKKLCKQKTFQYDKIEKGRFYYGKNELSKEVNDYMDEYIKTNTIKNRDDV